MPAVRRPRSVLIVTAALVLPALQLVTATGSDAVASAPSASRSSAPAAPPATQASAAAVPDLPLGPTDLPQTVTTETLAAGVTRTLVVRGALDPTTPWVVELAVPALDDPDPDAPAQAVQDRASAQAAVQNLAAEGFTAEMQPVVQPVTADLPRSTIGYRIRLSETFTTREAAQAAASRVRAAGFSARDWYSGWDGGSDVPGQWTLNMITVDPKKFTGTLGASYGPDLARGETVTTLAGGLGAVAAVNAGFFVFSGDAPGDPAGAAVYEGQVESEPVGDRPVLVLPSDGDGADVVRPRWTGTVSVPGRRSPLTLDGLNRLPGQIRNCGGTGDQPTDLPQHDQTCTDAGELVAFTGAFADSTPSGAGREVVLDAAGRVVRVVERRGVWLSPGQRSVQAIGDRVAELDTVVVGRRLTLTTALTARGHGALGRHGQSVVNGGPELIRDGHLNITQKQDGMVRVDDPSFAYGWVLQRNPRTFAGVDRRGRTVLVTVDGRQADQLGLSIDETAKVAKKLGLRDAINLDGGGSTEMAIRGQLVNSPSDGSERAVGDVIFVRAGD